MRHLLAGTPAHVHARAWWFAGAHSAACFEVALLVVSHVALTNRSTQPVNTHVHTPHPIPHLCVCVCVVGE
jgi:hypothetical protein